jgi:flagellar basal body P-ring formation protein FlgA
MPDTHIIKSAVCMLAVLLLFGNPCPVRADHGTTIDLLSEAKVDGDTVTLGQIADIKALNTAQRAKLAGLEIGPAPEPGRVQWLQHNQIESGLKSHGVDPNSYTLNASGPVKVIRNYADLTATRVCAAVKAFILGAAPWDKQQINIRSLTYNQSHRLPPGKVDLKVSAPKHTDWIGAIPFTVDLYVDGRMIKRLTVSANIEVWSDVVVTAKPLGRNQPITAADITIEKVNLSRAPADAIVRRDQAIGLRTRRPLAIHTILCNEQIVKPPVIRRGDVVRIVAESPGLKVTTQGVAKEDGGVGERIRIINANSKKVIYARIVDSQTVQVRF